MFKKSLFVSRAWWTMGEIQPRVRHIGVNGVSSSLAYYLRPVVLSLPPDYSCGAARGGHAVGSAAVLVLLCPTWHSRQHPLQWGRTLLGPPNGIFPHGTPHHKGSPASEDNLTWEVLNVSWRFMHMEGKSSHFLQPPSTLVGLIWVEPGCVCAPEGQRGKKSLTWTEPPSVPLSVLNHPVLWLLHDRR